jgi:endonuclease/exonuclease/phosphatase family metal-dependent hydrolase
VIVASYNVHGGVGLDGQEDVERIGTVIRELGADVIGLQEVGATQLSRLASLMGLHPVDRRLVRATAAATTGPRCRAAPAAMPTGT